MENQKKVIFAFRGDPLCFIHVLLNGIDLHERGQEGLIIIEGEAVTLVPEMSKPGHFLSSLYQKAKNLDILFPGKLQFPPKRSIPPVEMWGFFYG